MISKTITYDDLNGNEVSKKLYFNLSKFDLAKMDVEYEDEVFTYTNEAGEEVTVNGTEAVIRDIMAKPKGKKILAFIENLVQKSYGERVDDEQFRKSPEILNSFMATDAYGALILGFANNTEEFSEFMQGIISKKLKEEAAKLKVEGF